MELMIAFGYIVSAILFVLGLKKLGSPATARQGNLVSAVGMLVAVCLTLLDRDILGFQWILVGCVIGSIIGVLFAKMVAMTAMPEMVALFNGFGGISSLLLGVGVVFINPSQHQTMYATG
jgi:NAD(P) transhydrogenase subunit beta